MQDTEEAQEESFVHEKVKEQIQNSESEVSRICNSIWTHQEEFRKNCDSLRLINTDKNKESTDLFRINELLLKVCIQLFMNSRISHTIDAKDEKMILK